jgi:hypothetical protein
LGPHRPPPGRCRGVPAAPHKPLSVAARVPLTLEEVDISRDPELERRYGIEIPVLLMGTKKVAKYRVSEGELLRILQARS